MKKISISSFKKNTIGAMPGTITYVGDKQGLVTTNSISYDKDTYHESHDITVADLQEKFQNHQDTVHWINVTGVHDISSLEEIGNVFSIHPLVLEDIANTTHRAKVEEYDDYIFVVLKMIYNHPTTHDIIIEQVSIITGKNYVITFQETTYDIFDTLRTRIQEGKGKIRSLYSDYLLFSLIDIVTDHYFLILETMSNDLEIIEEKLLLEHAEETQSMLYQVKRKLIHFKKHLWPAREITNHLLRTDHDLISPNTKIYLRDTYDHTIHVIETLESMRDVIGGMMDLHLSIMSNKMNEIMKVLTIFSALFIPLTFLAGVYGMNFTFMPELGWTRGYGGFWLITILISISMLVYFRKNKWL